MRYLRGTLRNPTHEDLLTDIKYILQKARCQA